MSQARVRRAPAPFALALAALASAGSIPLAAQPVDSARAPSAKAPWLCLRDAATGDGITRATVQLGTGPALVTDEACVAVPMGTAPVEVRRLGYRPWRGVVANVDTQWVALVPVAAALPASVTRAEAPASAPMATSRDVDEARALGVGASGALVALLPYTQPRSARGEVSVSLRGARREQVAITLDGLPLTDPATGLADVADIPLAALGSATVAPGSDPLGAGPGAIGGVLALRSGRGSVLSTRLGAFGAGGIEAATDLSLGGERVRIGASRSVARNDFAFRNSVTSPGESPIERRVNNDVTRHALFTSWTGVRTQLTLLGAQTEQGLVGPVNVRAYDEDRAHTRRLFVRATRDVDRVLITTGVRAFALGYRDPQRPMFDRDARVLAADVDARGSVQGVLLQGGGGVDRLRASDGLAQSRGRGWLAASHARDVIGLQWQGGVRLDGVTGANGTSATDEPSGAGLWPSFSLASERRMRLAAAHEAVVGMRLAQALRVPTLYDLYFSSPQRLTVRTLRPERVDLDGELFARWRTHARDWTLAVDGALVARRSRDAIVWFPGNFGWSPANVGRESVHGLEVRAEAQRDHLLLAAWSTWYRATLQSGALRIPTPYVPETAAGLVARAPLARTVLARTPFARSPLGAIEAGLVGRVTGSRPYTAGPRDPFFRLPAVTLVDLSLASRHRVREADWLLTAALENVTDVAWQSVRGFPAPGRAWSVALTIQP